MSTDLVTELASGTDRMPSRTKAMSRASRRRRVTGIPPLRGLVPLSVALVIWQFVASPKSAYFPRPSDWWTAVYKLWSDGKLEPAVVATTRGVFISLALMVVIGTALGWLVGRSRILDRLVGPLLEFLRVIPPAAIVPIAVLFGGYNDVTKVVVVVLTAVWPILLQVRASTREMASSLQEVAKAMHLGRIETIRKISLPSIVPGLLVGIRVAAPIALISTLLVELLTNIPGVGALISAAQTSFQAPTVYGLVAVAGILGVLASILLYIFEAALGRYAPGRGSNPH